jgi:CheY-like chemotaxis protein
MLEQLEKSLHDFLLHLYDPAYRLPEPLLATIGCSAELGYECSRAAIIRAIDSLRPPPDSPPGTRQLRLYQLLHQRFVEALTQEETSERLGLTSRHLRREEQEAVSLLLRRLVELNSASVPEQWRVQVQGGQPTDAGSDASSPAWRSQMHQELAALQRGAPANAADVAEALERVADMGRALSTERNIEMIVEPHESTLLAIIHPAVLRQVIALTLEAFLTRMNRGSIRFAAERAGNRISVTLTAAPAGANDPPPDLESIHSILATQNGACSIDRRNAALIVKLDLAAAETLHVLVVDDNADMVYLYRRYATGSRFSVEHFDSQEPLFRFVETDPPDVIVLDVMMPGADGWQLLTQLHEHPFTRPIPVIICSVIKGKQLALALGATCYLAKPISRQQFIEALEQAVSKTGVSTAASPSTARSAGREQQR